MNLINYRSETDKYLVKQWTSAQRGPVRQNLFVAITDTTVLEEVRGVETESILITLT